MLCAAMIFTTVTTLLRHLARAQKRKTNLRSHDLKNIGKETSIYKSEGNFSHIRKLLMTFVILAWRHIMRHIMRRIQRFPFTRYAPINV